MLNVGDGGGSAALGEGMRRWTRSNSRGGISVAFFLLDASPV